MKTNQRAAHSTLRILVTLVFMPVAWFDFAIPATAQTVDADGNATMGISAVTHDAATIGARFTVTTTTGEFLGACTLEGDPTDFSHLPACYVQVPWGTTVVVTEDVSTVPPGYGPEENPLYFDTSSIDGSASFEGVIFNNVLLGDSAGTSGTSDIAIVTTENGQSVTDACYVLVDFSNEGCDENGDGMVTFQDVPLGIYVVQQTANLGSGRVVPDFTISVTGAVSSDGWERFNATVTGPSSGVPNSTAPVDIALITRAPEDGRLLTGTCYILVGYSNEGCDENGDGQVTFAAIPPGTYTVHQTLTPAGHPVVNDFEITVENTFDAPLGFVVKQAAEQNAPNTRNVSVVFLDSRTHAKITSGICVQFVGASNVGCDEDLIDGQIDFLDVPAGTFEVEFSNIPAGWQILGQNMVAPVLTIDAGSRTPSNLFTYVEVYTSDSTSSNTEDGASSSTAGVSSSTNAEPISLVGTWGRQHVLLVINPDGTGVLDVNSGCCTGVHYVLAVDFQSTPVTATIVSRSFLATEGFTPLDEDAAAMPGDILTFEVTRGAEGYLLDITFPASGQRSLSRIRVCQPAQHFCEGT